jgi:hypothetical protein
MKLATHLVGLFAFLLCTGVFAAERVRLTSQDAIRELSSLFKDRASFSGKSSGRPCRVAVLSLESRAGGLAVQIEDANGRVSSVEISNPNTNVVRIREAVGSWISHYYIVRGDSASDASVIVVSKDQSSSAMEVRVGPVTNPARVTLTCSSR